MNEATVSRILKGKGKSISQDSIDALCKTFNVTELELYILAHGAGDSIIKEDALQLSDKFDNFAKWLRTHSPHVQEAVLKLGEVLGWEG